MAYKIISNGSNINSQTVEIVVDTLAEMEEDGFPGASDVGIGSDCIVLENSSVWMLGNDGSWHEL